MKLPHIGWDSPASVYVMRQIRKGVNGWTPDDRSGSLIDRRVIAPVYGTPPDPKKLLPKQNLGALSCDRRILRSRCDHEPESSTNARGRPPCCLEIREENAKQTENQSAIVDRMPPRLEPKRTCLPLLYTLGPGGKYSTAVAPHHWEDIIMERRPRVGGARHVNIKELPAFLGRMTRERGPRGVGRAGRGNLWREHISKLHIRRPSLVWLSWDLQYIQTSETSNKSCRLPVPCPDAYLLHEKSAIET